MCTMERELVEGNGYESRQTSEWRAWLGHVTLSLQKQDGVSSDVRGESRVVFPL